MQSPSGSQGRISQLIREERTSDPDNDPNLHLLQLTSLYETIELSSLNRNRFDSEETASIDSSNPASPSSPNPFKSRPSNIYIHIPNSNLRHTPLQRTSFIPDRKRKNENACDDYLDRISALRNITRSISPSHLSPRSVSPMGECRSAPQSPLCRSATWELRPQSSLSGSNLSISSPSSYASSEYFIHPPKLVIPPQYQTESISSGSPNTFTPNTNDAFIYPDRPMPEEVTEVSTVRSEPRQFRTKKRMLCGRFPRNNCIRIRRSDTVNLESNRVNDCTQSNSIKKRKLE